MSMANWSVWPSLKRSWILNAIRFGSIVMQYPSAFLNSNCTTNRPPNSGMRLLSGMYFRKRLGHSLNLVLQIPLGGGRFCVQHY